MTHYTTRKHFFRDEQDNRAEVETTMTAKGEYVAELIETTGGALELLNLSGYGHSRLAAIADLQAKIGDEAHDGA
jgi:hypothetical protein